MKSTNIMSFIHFHPNKNTTQVFLGIFGSLNNKGHGKTLTMLEKPNIIIYRMIYIQAGVA
jgi:hypothetical protein